MITASVSIDNEILEAIRDRAGQASGIMRTLQRLRITRIRSQIKADLQPPDAQPDLPFVWSYDPAAQKRARGYYFAVIVPKGSRGGRYQRTGKMAAAWDVLFTDARDSASITLENDRPGAEYVYGDKQVLSHYLTGWSQLDEIVQRNQEALNLGLIEDWYTATDPTAGVR